MHKQGILSACNVGNAIAVLYCMIPCSSSSFIYRLLGTKPSPGIIYCAMREHGLLHCNLNLFSHSFYTEIHMQKYTQPHWQANVSLFIQQPLKHKCGAPLACMLSLCTRKEVFILSRYSGFRCQKEIQLMCSRMSVLCIRFFRMKLYS